MNRLARKLYTLRKREKIKSRKVTGQIFESGKGFTLPPFRVIYLTEKGSGIQTGFAVGTRFFKKATDRNRIKRLMRESFRLQKISTVEWLEKNAIRLSVFFVYTGNELPQQEEIHLKMKAALQKLQTLI